MVFHYISLSTLRQKHSFIHSTTIPFLSTGDIAIIKIKSQLLRSLYSREGETIPPNQNNSVRNGGQCYGGKAEGGRDEREERVEEGHSMSCGQGRPCLADDS